MKKILKYINSIPFPFTMRHYQIFGETASKMKNNELASVESWNVLRREHPHFSVPTSREEWLYVSEANVKKDGQDSLFVERAKDAIKLLRRENVKKIFSVGVGGAGLEYQIKKNMPEVNLVCSEYSMDNVELLKKVFIESDNVVKFDVLKDSWLEVKEKYLKNNGICLIYRIDASFSDDEWFKIFKDIHSAGIEKILLIPTGMLTILSIFNRKWREIKWFFKRTPVLFSGHIRTKKQFEKFWKGFYNHEDLFLGGFKGFLLKIKK
jgi:hypothetical protein